MSVIERRSQIEVSVVTGMGAMMQAMAIRAAVFIGEFGCSHDEEFDGNDFSATHIIAKVGGEPAGTMRLRYFANFVIPERLAVLPAYRKGRYGDRGVAYALGTFSFNLSRMKGYRRFVGYSVLGLEQFWDRVALASGGRVDRFGDAPIECSGSTCIGVYGSLDPLPGAVDTRENHEVLTACEAELPSHVTQRALMEQSDMGAAQLPARDNRRVRDQRATDHRGGDRRAGDRRAQDRRATDRRAKTELMAVDLRQDQGVENRRARDRRARDRRANDRRGDDRRNVQHHAAADRHNALHHYIDLVAVA